MIILYSTEAHRQMLRVDLWWRGHRRDSPDLFELELDDALERLATMGEMIGQPYTTIGDLAIRRLELKKTRQWVYYSIDRDAALLKIHAIWGRARGSGPLLPTP